MVSIDAVKVSGKPQNEYARCGNCRRYLRDKGCYYLVYADGRRFTSHGYDSMDCIKFFLNEYYGPDNYVLTYVGESEQETK